MSSQIKYDRVSTSCMDIYNNLVGNLPSSGNDAKTLKKAVAFMNRGQGKYNDVFEGVDACVYPNETLSIMNIEGNCLLKNSDTDDIVNNNFVESIGGVMEQNRVIANQNIAQGKGLYPSNGCGISTNEPGLFKKAVADSGSVIDFENQKILNSLKDEIVKLNLEIKDISQVQIPNQRKVLDATIKKYKEILADCNYHKWLREWFNNYGKPYITDIITKNSNYLNWLQNSYGPSVYNYEKWLENRCREKNKVKCGAANGWCWHPGAILKKIDCNNEISWTCEDTNSATGSLKGPTCGSDWPNADISYSKNNNCKITETKRTELNNGTVSCNTYCAGIFGRSWNNELPYNWNGADCVATADNSKGCDDVKGSPAKCVCIPNGKGWNKGGW
jgi:hypothetical protein